MEDFFLGINDVDSNWLNYKKIIFCSRGIEENIELHSKNEKNSGKLINKVLLNFKPFYPFPFC